MAGRLVLLLLTSLALLLPHSAAADEKHTVRRVIANALFRFAQDCGGKPKYNSQLPSVFDPTRLADGWLRVPQGGFGATIAPVPLFASSFLNSSAGRVIRMQQSAPLPLGQEVTFDRVGATFSARCGDLLNADTKLGAMFPGIGADAEARIRRKRNHSITVRVGTYSSDLPERLTQPWSPATAPIFEALLQHYLDHPQQRFYVRSLPAVHIFRGVKTEDLTMARADLSFAFAVTGSLSVEKSSSALSEGASVRTVLTGALKGKTVSSDIQLAQLPSRATIERAIARQLIVEQVDHQGNVQTGPVEWNWGTTGTLRFRALYANRTTEVGATVCDALGSHDNGTLNHRYKTIHRRRQHGHCYLELTFEPDTFHVAKGQLDAPTIALKLAGYTAWRIPVQIVHKGDATASYERAPVCTPQGNQYLCKVQLRLRGDNLPPTKKFQTTGFDCGDSTIIDIGPEVVLDTTATVTVPVAPVQDRECRWDALVELQRWDNSEEHLLLETQTVSLPAAPVARTGSRPTQANRPLNPDGDAEPPRLAGRPHQGGG